MFQSHRYRFIKIFESYYINNIILIERREKGKLIDKDKIQMRDKYI